MANLELILCRDGNCLCLSRKDGNPLEATFVTTLNAEFSYTLKTVKSGGRGISYEYTREYLMRSLDAYRMSCAYGLSDSLSDFLKGMGCIVHRVDLTPEKNNSLLLKPDWSVLDKVSLRPGQKECLQSFVNGRHGVINAPTGFGKTTLIGLLIQMYPDAKFHICTKSVDIAKNIYSRMLAITPSVGRIGGGFDESDKRVTVITADSLSKSDGKADFFIFDECHQAAAPTYSNKITQLYKYSRNYGFSATPTGRGDGADRVLTALFGRELFSLSYDAGVDLGLVVPVRVTWLNAYRAPAGATDYVQPVALKRHCIWANDYRNQLIADHVQANYTDTEQILILVATVEHAVTLAQFLPDFTLVYGSMTAEDCKYYQDRGLLPRDYVPLKAKNKDALKKQFEAGTLRRVIATDVWNTGVDFPSLSVVYNVSGRASKILNAQGGGRVSRIFSGKSRGTVIDVVDTFDGKQSSFYSSALARRKQYKALGWSQEGWPDDRRG